MICLLVSEVGLVPVLVDGRFSILAVEVATADGHSLVALELLLGGLPVHQLVLAVVADASASQAASPLIGANSAHRHIDAHARPVSRQLILVLHYQLGVPFPRRHLEAPLLDVLHVLHILDVLDVLLSLLLRISLSSGRTYVGDWAHVVAGWDLIRHEDGAVLCQSWHLIAFVG